VSYPVVSRAFFVSCPAFRVLGFCVVLASAGCSGRQTRPQGPPPEYEPRVMSPWPPEVAPSAAPSAAEPPSTPLPSAATSVAPEVESPVLSSALEPVTAPAGS
jgi:hypothetical protein